MSKEVKIPAGTRDFLPEMMQKRQYIFQTLKSVFEKYGYEPIETPAMELLSTLMGKYGEEGDKLLFRILNSGDFMQNLPKTKSFNFKTATTEILPFLSEKGLRYDLTVPLARFVVMYRNQIQLPFKRYQIQPVWRADKPQKGRYREFYQCDIDIVGSKSILDELEMLMIIDEVFNTFGIEVTIYINNRKILDIILEQLNLKSMLKKIAITIDKIEKIGIEAVQNELDKIGIPKNKIEQLLDYIQIKGNLVEIVNQLESKFSNQKSSIDVLTEIKQISDYLELMNLNTPILFDLSLMRGLDYYTGFIFEVKANGVKIGSLCGGGRYDNLTETFGMPDISGIGISFGAERIYDVLNELNKFPTTVGKNNKILFLNLGYSEVKYLLPLMQKLRSNDISCEIYPECKKIQKQLQYAHKKNYPFVVIAGTDEINQNIITVKNMKTGQQISITPDQIVEFFKKQQL